MNCVPCFNKVKDYLSWKRFSHVAYVCITLHLLAGVAITTATVTLRESEARKFSCSFDDDATKRYKSKVEQMCFSKYENTYNSPLLLYQFVSLNFGCTVIISVVYSLIVSRRVDEIESNLKQETDGEDGLNGQNNRTVYIFYSYFAHLVLRSLFVIILTILQYSYFFPNSFESNFSCLIPSTEINGPKIHGQQQNRTLYSVQCENSTSLEKWIWGLLVSIINIITAIVLLGEVIFLCSRWQIFGSRSAVAWSCDTGFVVDYFFRKTYEAPKTSDECIKLYKKAVLDRGKKTGLGDSYIDVVIHTERALYKFPKEMGRHEIYETYMKVPENSIRLEKIEDLFRPDEDTKGDIPLSILATGRPGIGKTSLAEKIYSNWAGDFDKYYTDKIVFFFNFRLFKGSQWTKLTLKEFLQLGTGLGNKIFKSLYDTVVKQPSKAILIFDGLDEFHGDANDCFQKSRTIPNDLDRYMSAMVLFIKLVLGDFLKGGTVLVTSRPTADFFFSNTKIKFDRDVEIIGFTAEKIEEYVKAFCRDKNRNDLKSIIWNHIKSSSDLLNLCYIPVNCDIVCITLFRHDSGHARPTTLTELYKDALYRLEQYHFKEANKDSSSQESVLKKLEELAFRGMEHGQLVFDYKSVDEQTKASGLLNRISTPTSPEEYCFLHLTIQEFLAAKHVTEAFAPDQIRKFILEHFKSGRWHLVIQFIAGFLGQKMSNMEIEYKDACGLACVFAEFLEVINDEIELTYNQVFIMKCLREVDDENIVKDVCDTTILNDVEKIYDSANNISSSDLAAVTFVCKYMKNLIILDLNTLCKDGLQNVFELLRRRCINQLSLHLQRCMLGDLFVSLMNVNCTLNHKHVKLTSLRLDSLQLVNDVGLSNMCAFFKKGYARHLKKLQLIANKIKSFHSTKLFKVFCNKYCPELEGLCLHRNAVSVEAANTLWDRLNEGLCNLVMLELSCCSLTSHCISKLCKALQSERCNLTALSLSDNVIDDIGVSMLLESALTKESSKLTTLYLAGCSLTSRCILSLCKALQSEYCKLTLLSLSNNVLDDDGVKTLFQKALTKQHCKLTTLYLDSCFLRDGCIHSLCNALQNKTCQLTSLSLSRNGISMFGASVLFAYGLTNEHCNITTLQLESCGLNYQFVSAICKALQDKHCQLTYLSLSHNYICDEGVNQLSDAYLTNDFCKLSTLVLEFCNLSNQCIPSLSKALQDERCKLTTLSLSHNSLGDDGVSTLFEEALTNVHCKLTELSLRRCSLTDQCLRNLCETLQNKNCGLTKLHLELNKFTVNGKQSLYDIRQNEKCKNRGLRIYLEDAWWVLSRTDIQFCK